MSSLELESEWYDGFFEGLALDVWELACSTQQTTAECDLLESLLAVPPGARLLDVPCGLGRHLLEMTERGYAMTGVDLSGEAMERTDSKARSLGMKVELKKGDMRRFSTTSPFDGAYCLGNSFGYFDYDGSIDFFRALSRALKPSSALVLDTGMAAESILPNLDEKNWVQLGDMFLLLEHEYHADESRVDTRFSFVRGEATEVRRASHYVFTVSEISRMLREADFSIRGLYNSTCREPFAVGDTMLIVWAARD